jgi:hypothetical protein
VRPRRRVDERVLRVSDSKHGTASTLELTLCFLGVGSAPPFSFSRALSPSSSPSLSSRFRLPATATSRSCSRLAGVPALCVGLAGVCAGVFALLDACGVRASASASRLSASTAAQSIPISISSSALEPAAVPGPGAQSPAAAAAAVDAMPAWALFLFGVKGAGPKANFPAVERLDGENHSPIPAPVPAAPRPRRRDVGVQETSPPRRLPFGVVGGTASAGAGVGPPLGPEAPPLPLPLPAPASASAPEAASLSASTSSAHLKNLQLATSSRPKGHV